MFAAVYGTTFIRCDVNVIGINPINNRGSLPKTQMQKAIRIHWKPTHAHIIHLVTGQFAFTYIYRCI